MLAPDFVRIGSSRRSTDGVPQLTRITHADRKALQTFDGFPDAFAANRGAHDALHVRYRHAIAADGIAIDVDFDVTATGESFGQRRADPRHVFDRTLYGSSDLVDDRGVAA